MTLIGIGGRLAAGKDAVADYLDAERGYVKMGMSDALLEAALVLDPWIGDRGGWSDVNDRVWNGNSTRLRTIVELEGYTEAKRRSEVRRFLQVLGTEVGRQMIGENVWVDMMERRLRGTVEPVVVTGIRYPNELEMIQRLGGRTWWVSRPELQPGDSSKHASENGVSLADFQTHIKNDGSLEDLYRTVEENL